MASYERTMLPSARTSIRMTIPVVFLLVAGLGIAAPASQPAERAKPAKGAKRGTAAKGHPYFSDLLGLETVMMSKEERKQVVGRANKEFCTCGCKHTIAECLNVDVGCPFALPLAKLIAAEVSPNFKKLVDEVELGNIAKYRHPTEEMMLHFDYLKGFDLDELSEKQREMLLLKANTNLCDCSCGETLAKCVNTDPTCRVSPMRLHELIDAIKQETIIK